MRLLTALAKHAQGMQPEPLYATFDALMQLLLADGVSGEVMSVCPCGGACGAASTRLDDVARGRAKRRMRATPTGPSRPPRNAHRAARRSWCGSSSIARQR